MKIKGVLDRIVDDRFGTILVEEINQEFTLNIEQLPANSKEGDWFDLVLTGGKVANITFNEALTKEGKDKIMDKMAMLKKRSGSKFKKK